MQSINPTTGQVVKEYPEPAIPEVRDRIEAAHEAYLSWRTTSFSDRSTLMKKAAELLRSRSEEFARLMALEMGKPIRQGRAEAEKCAWVCDFYANSAEEFLAPIPIETDAKESFVSFQPQGVVLAVMPWNFPFWQVFRFAAPALMAGNGGLLKHASCVPGCAVAIEDVFREAGFPENVFCTLLIGSSTVDAVIEDRKVVAVTLTGSTPAGRSVAARAGQMLKKSVMELGGSDPYVVLEDADLDKAVPICVESRLINSGQSCINAKRFVVVDPIASEFEQRTVDEMKKRKVGDPLDEVTDVGPLARRDLCDEVHQQVRMSIEMGARVLLGGDPPSEEGAFYSPTVLTDVPKGCPAYDDEIFGPVASILKVRDEAEAIRVANDSVFGLGAAVFTRDEQRGRRIAEEELHAGCCFVNDFVRSDPRLPFGGVKESGYGRELGDLGIREFVNIKTVYVGG